MSPNEENVIITPWVGSASYRNSLTVVVISSSADIIKVISEALKNVHAVSNARWKLVLIRSYSLERIAMQSNITGRLSIDFIVIAVDTSRMFCIDSTSTALKSVHPDLRIRRVVLVNTCGAPSNVDSNEILSFCTENRLEMLNANVSKPEEVNFLARRLLKYIEVSVGVKTGIPNLNI